MRNRTSWIALGILCVAMLLAEVVRPTANESSIASLPATSSPTIVPTTPPTAVPPTITPTPAPTVAPTVIAADVNDTPHLSDHVAPTAPPQPVAAQPAEPIRLQIPAIGLDYQPVAVGLDENRVPVVPQHDVGWYKWSAVPGQNNNVVFWAHVLRFKAAPDIPAPFARVKELQPGAEIIVTVADGREARYRVTEAVQVTPDQVQYILPTDHERLTLVSCIGDKVIENGSVTKKYRLVTIAEPVE